MPFCGGPFRSNPIYRHLSEHEQGGGDDIFWGLLHQVKSSCFNVGIQTNKEAVLLYTCSLLIAHFSDLSPSSLL